MLILNKKVCAGKTEIFTHELNDCKRGLEDFWGRSISVEFIGCGNRPPYIKNITTFVILPLLSTHNLTPFWLTGHIILRLVASYLEIDTFFLGVVNISLVKIMHKTHKHIRTNTPTHTHTSR